MTKACQLFLVPSRSSNPPLYPSKGCELGSVLRLLLFRCFLLGHLSPLRSWGCVRFPTIECLQYHLPNQQMVMFDDDDDVQEVATRSAISRMMLIEWFKINQESEVAQSLTFDQFPQQWVWNWKLKRWTMCKRGFAIGRMYYAHPTSGERYYLRMLLNCIKGATSYEHLQIVDGIVHDTFKDACIAMGLFANDNEWHQTLEKASVWASG